MVIIDNHSENPPNPHNDNDNHSEDDNTRNTFGEKDSPNDKTITTISLEKDKPVKLSAQFNGVGGTMGTDGLDFIDAGTEKQTNKELDSIANYLKTNPDSKIIITGNTSGFVSGGDMVYDDNGNLLADPQIAIKRANKVADMLKNKGIPTSQIITKANNTSGEQYVKIEIK